MECWNGFNLSLITVGSWSIVYCWLIAYCWILVGGLLLVYSWFSSVSQADQWDVGMGSMDNKDHQDDWNGTVVDGFLVDYLLLVYFCFLVDCLLLVYSCPGKTSEWF